MIQHKNIKPNKGIVLVQKTKTDLIQDSGGTWDAKVEATPDGDSFPLVGSNIRMSDNAPILSEVETDVGTLLLVPIHSILFTY